MLKNAVDVKRNYLERNYPDIIQKIISAINSAIENDNRDVQIFFTRSEWYTFNYVDVEWYLNLFEYKCNYDTDTIDWDNVGYKITVEWYLE